VTFSGRGYALLGSAIEAVSTRSVCKPGCTWLKRRSSSGAIPRR
jgi:hypothetical protein